VLVCAITTATVADGGSTVASTLGFAPAHGGTLNGATASQPAQRMLSTVPTFGGCRVFPANNAFNTPISNLPVRPESAATIARTTATGGWDKMRFAFWSEPTSGMHPISVPANQPLVPITYTHYPQESDPGPMPIPLNAPREDNTDKHILVVQETTCRLYELWLTTRNNATGGWNAGTGAIWDMNSNATRPPNWTSADAAGLPILPGLLRYEEVASGRINHALRMLVGTSRNAYIAPAAHQVGVNDPHLFPMGARLRLRADFNLSGFTGQSLVIATAMKEFGVIVADQGPVWMISGVGDSRWNDTNMNQIRNIPASAFEYVDNGPVVVR
jgi:hypothetical protein